MTRSEAVIRAAGILPDGVDREELRRYIDELDLKARNQMFSNSKKSDGTGGDTEDVLIIPEPYDMAYVFYAVACVWFRREEFELYNNYRELSCNIYNEYMRLFNRGRSGTANKIRNLW